MSRISNWSDDLTPWGNATPAPADTYADFEIGQISDKATIEWNLEQQKQFDAQQKEVEAIDPKLSPEQVRAEFNKQQQAESARFAAGPN